MAVGQINYLLKSLAKFHNLTGHQFAQKIGRSQAYVSLLMNGYQFPTKSEAEIISKLVQARVSDLFENVRKERK